jgi:hypothetical protein
VVRSQLVSRRQFLISDKGRRLHRATGTDESTFRPPLDAPSRRAWVVLEESFPRLIPWRTRERERRAASGAALRRTGRGAIGVAWLTLWTNEMTMMAERIFVGSH